MATKSNVVKLNFDTGKPFEFSFPDSDEVFTLPSMRALNGDQLIAIMEADDSDSPVERIKRMYEVFDELCPGLGEAARKYNFFVLSDVLLGEWQKASGISMGE